MPTDRASKRPAKGLDVTIYSDVICPWCYVGKRRFEAALDGPEMPKVLAVAWRPFELNPDMPPEGMDRAAYRARKFGAERAHQLDEQMREVGREAGIAFAFEHMRRTPSTRLAHRLVWDAERQGGATAQNAIVNRLFAGYFEEGADIGDPATLLDMAAEVGLDGKSAADALAGSESLDAVVALEQAGLRMGIQGVPFFVLAGKYAVSGAQPPEVWRDALPKIAAESRR
jgi:predicted DsbA family dithiol-disulfide isomerase